MCLKETFRQCAFLNNRKQPKNKEYIKDGWGKGARGWVGVLNNYISSLTQKNWHCNILYTLKELSGLQTATCRGLRQGAL